MAQADDLGVVVIGRNEGERLRLCLSSLQQVGTRVYVDSGSTDGSQAVARTFGFELVELAVPPQFTAARARNAGVVKLLELNPSIRFVQMVDGDCEVVEGWLDAGYAELKANAGLAAVFGRRRERYPGASLYNLICDDEWDVPVGEAQSCGGDALFRLDALLGAGGYTESLIGGEEPDLCLRMRDKNWTIRRIDSEMTLHDVDISRFSQWWKRAQRGGHAAAELTYLHRARAWAQRRQLASALLWASIGLSAPLLLCLALIFEQRLLAVAAACLGLLFIFQGLRLFIRHRSAGMPLRQAASWASLDMIGKFAQLQGVLQFCWNRLTGTTSRLIEYKT